jgi:ribose transport system substrate-binding protein
LVVNHHLLIQIIYMNKAVFFGMSAWLFLSSTPLLAENIAIGFAHADLNNPYYIAMEKMAYTQAAARGVKMTVLNAGNDQVIQNKQIDALLDTGIKGLIVNSVNEYGSMAAIKKAKNRGIPVVAIDRPLYGDYLAYVGIDQWRAGELQGEYIFKHLLPKGGNIVMLLGIPGEPATIGRESGMLNVIQHPKLGGKFKILGSYRADYSMELGYQKMKEAITTFGDKINLVYGLNDAMALGALKALREAGLDRVMIVGIDGQKEAYDEIEKGGQYKATVINNPDEITRKAVDLLVDHIKSGKPPASNSVITGTILVTKDNVAKHQNPEALF